MEYNIWYKKDHNFISFQPPALILENKSALDNAYISKKPIDRILIVCHDIQQEHKRLNILLMIVYRYNKVLDRELAVLAKKEEFCWSTKEALKNQ